MGSSGGAVPEVRDAEKECGWGTCDRLLMAVLCRAVALGTRFESEDGETEEGDPWACVVYPTGGTFLHVCRVDGHYHAFGDALEAPVSDTSLWEFLEALGKRFGPCVEAARGNLRMEVKIA